MLSIAISIFNTHLTQVCSLLLIVIVYQDNEQYSMCIGLLVKPLTAEHNNIRCQLTSDASLFFILNRHLYQDNEQYGI